MRLLPAAVIIVFAFATALLFLQGRRSFRRLPGPDGASQGGMRKVAFFILVSGLLALSGLLFMLLGKIALLIALLVAALFFLTSRKL